MSKQKQQAVRPEATRSPTDAPRPPLRRRRPHPGPDRVACPNLRCGRTMPKVEKLAYQEVVCPHCGEQFEMPGGELSWLDGQLVKAASGSVEVLSIVLPGIAFLLGLVGLIWCRHPTARERATVLTFLGGSLQLLGIVACYLIFERAG